MSLCQVMEVRRDEIWLSAARVVQDGKEVGFLADIKIPKRASKTGCLKGFFGASEGDFPRHRAFALRFDDFQGRGVEVYLCTFIGLDEFRVHPRADGTWFAFWRPLRPDEYHL